MSSWGRLDQADNAPLWAGNQLGLAPSDANRTNLFEDATADNFITGMTIGLYNYNASDLSSDAASHTGWNLKFIKGSRTYYECLVVLANPA